jgi:hypothetical protein
LALGGGRTTPMGHGDGSATPIRPGLNCTSSWTEPRSPLIRPSVLPNSHRNSLLKPQDSNKKEKPHCPNHVRQSAILPLVGPPVRPLSAPSHWTSAWTEPHNPLFPPSSPNPSVRPSAVCPPQITVCGRSEDLERQKLHLRFNELCLVLILYFFS